MRRRLLLLVVLLAAAAGAFYAFTIPPRALVLTGIVTTNDVIVSPQVDGRLARLLVQEGDTVTRDQLLALIDPRELEADSAYYASAEQGVTAQVDEAEEAVRYEQRQTEDQIAQASATVKAAQAQQAEAAAALERAQLDLTRTKQLADQGLTTASELDRARTAFDAARAHVDALARQVETAEAALALANASASQVAMKRTQLQNARHMRHAAQALR